MFRRRGRPFGSVPGPRCGTPGYMQQGWFDGPPRHLYPDGGPWQYNGPHYTHPHRSQMGPPPPPMPMPSGISVQGNNIEENVWGEILTGDEKSYFYHTVTHETTWERPEGSNVRIVRHDEWMANLAGRGMPGTVNFGSSGPPGTGNLGPEACAQGGPPPGPPQQNVGPHSISAHGPRFPPFSGHGPPHMPMGPPPHQGSPYNMHGITTGHLQGQGPIHRPPEPIPGKPPADTLPMSPNAATPLGQSPRPSPVGQTYTGPAPPYPSGPPFGSPVHFRPSFPPGEFGNSPTPVKAKIGIEPVMNNMPMPNPLAQPPGFPPFGPMGTPPFGMPPPTESPRNFTMVAPPWCPVPGVPPPTGVPPPPIVPDVTAVSQMDPRILLQANEWTEHVAPDGIPYYFNNKTQISVWEKPQILIDFKAAKGIVQQEVDIKGTKEINNDKIESNGNTKKSKDQKKEEAKKMGTVKKCRPISSIPISGTPWCVVWTGDKRVFFYNPSYKQSVWERPAVLVGRTDVDEFVKFPPEGKLSKVKKVEATSTTSPSLVADSQNATTENSKSEFKENTSKRTPDDATEPPAKKVKQDSINTEDVTKSEPSVIDLTDGSPGEAVMMDLVLDNRPNDKTFVKTDDEKTRIETKDALKDANALEAEVKAAHERATIPLDIRLQKFREMLEEKQVSAFSTWEKELHKIVFDPRYLLLTSKERKTAFENFVREIAEEEKREKKTRMKHDKEKFVLFLKQIYVNQRTTYNEVSQKFGRHESFKMVEKARDREMFFAEYISELKRKDKEDRMLKREKAKESFLIGLRKEINNYHLKWSDVKRTFDNDPCYEILDQKEREELFKIYQKRLRYETRAREKRNKREKKEKLKEEEQKEREREKARKKQHQESEDQDKLKDIEHDGDYADADDKKKDKLLAKNDLDNTDNLEDISEEEEGCIPDSDEEVQLEREKKERVELSMRERERQVQRTLATHLRDRDKERELYRHEEAVQEFRALLTDIVRNVEISWKDVKKDLKSDRRWASFSILSSHEMEDLFNQHCNFISNKKNQRFRVMLNEARVKLTSKWIDIQKKIKDDPRYLKFSNSERKCEREFELYLKELRASMKRDFRELLKETKMLTYKTKRQINENSCIMKNIESLLSQDKRYLQLDGMQDERRQILTEFLDDLERRGSPPPPTASERQHRMNIWVPGLKYNEK